MQDTQNMTLLTLLTVLLLLRPSSADGDIIMVMVDEKEERVSLRKYQNNTEISSVSLTNYRKLK